MSEPKREVEGPAEEAPASLKQQLWEIVFEAETPWGKRFDIALLWLIMLSVAVVIIESMDAVRLSFQSTFLVLEWSFTILFTIEYLLRLWLVRKPLRYACSFFGVVDLLSILPTYATLLPFVGSVHALVVIRILRLLRMFRVLKMVHHVKGANLLVHSIYASRAKITVFLMAMAIFASLMGTMAYILEKGKGGGIDDIPTGIYWAVVTMTTLGYGDVTPVTHLGKFLTVITSLSGFAIIAVPTGIFVSEVVNGQEKKEDFTDACPGCGSWGHLPDAKFCRKCGEKLDLEQ